MNKNLAIIIDEEIFRAVKVKIAKQDLTLREYITSLVLADLEKDKEKSDT